MARRHSRGPACEQRAPSRRHRGGEAGFEQHGVPQEGDEGAQGIGCDTPHLRLGTLAKPRRIRKDPIGVLERQFRQILSPTVHARDPVAISVGPQGPSGPAMGEGGEDLRALLIAVTRAQELDQGGPTDGGEGDHLATRQAGRKQVIRIGCREDEHRVRRRFFERLEQAVLGRFGHALGVGEESDPRRGDEGLQTQELLERLVMRLRALLGVEADLVDADRLRAIV